MKTLLLSFLLFAVAPHALAQSSTPEKLSAEQMIEQVSGEYKLLPRDQNYDNRCSLNPADTYKFSGELPAFIKEQTSDKAQLGPHLIFLSKYDGTDANFIKDYGYWLPAFSYRPYFSALNRSALEDEVQLVSIANKNLIYQTSNDNIVLTQELTMSGGEGASVALQMVTFSSSSEFVIATDADGKKTSSSRPAMHAKYQYILLMYGPQGAIEEIMYQDECVLKKEIL